MRFSADAPDMMLPLIEAPAPLATGLGGFGFPELIVYAILFSVATSISSIGLDIEWLLGFSDDTCCSCYCRIEGAAALPDGTAPLSSKIASSLIGVSSLGAPLLFCDPLSLST